MQKQEQLYEGKAKKVFKTDDPEVLMVDYKDDATAFNGEKKGTIASKGIINNKVTNHLMKMLEKEGIPTHLIEEVSDRETLVKKVTIVPLEVIIRNVAAGSFSKRYGVEEGRELCCPSLEFSLKDDALGDPLINSYHVLSLGLATQEEIDLIAKQDDTYIFIEVKYRTGRTAGDPTSAVDGKKQKKISKTADYYRMLHQIPMDVPCRFDVVAETPEEIRVYAHAFYYQGSGW